MRVDKKLRAYEVALIHRKVNVGMLQQPFGLLYRWDEERHAMIFEPTEIRDNPELAKGLGKEELLKSLLAMHGALSIDELQKAMNLTEPTVRKAIARVGDDVRRIEPGGKGPGKKVLYELNLPESPDPSAEDYQQEAF